MRVVCEHNYEPSRIEISKPSKSFLLTLESGRLNGTNLTIQKRMTDKQINDKYKSVELFHLPAACAQGRIQEYNLEGAIWRARSASL